MNALYRLYQAARQEYAFGLAIPALLWQLVFLYIPLFIMIGKTVWASQTSLFSYHCLLLVCDEVHVRVIVRSLLLSFSVALSCLIIAYPVAYYLALKVRRGKYILLFLLTLPFWTNFLIQTYAWIFIVEQHGLLNAILSWLHVIREPLHVLHTKFIIGFVMIYCYLPFMIIPLYLVLERFDKRLLEAACDLGATRVTAFFQITVPLTLTGMRTGFLLVMVPVYGDYAICSILGGHKYLFVGPLIAEYFMVTRDMMRSASFVMLALVGLLGGMGLVYSIFFVVGRRWQ